MDSLVLTFCKSTVTHKFPHSWRWPDDSAEGRGWAWLDGDVSTCDIRPAAEKSRILDLNCCRLTFFSVFYNNLCVCSPQVFLFFFNSLAVTGRHPWFELLGVGCSILCSFVTIAL